MSDSDAELLPAKSAKKLEDLDTRSDPKPTSADETIDSQAVRGCRAQIDVSGKH